VYAARKRLKSVLITETIGGQSMDSVGIENWIGTVKISGLDLAKSFETHLRAYASDVVDIKLGSRATKLEKKPEGSFVVKTTTGDFEARAVLVVTGGVRRKLEAAGAAEFENKGLTYCASCDGPLFSGQDVLVVGGGNAGFETASQLLAYAKSVTLVHRSAACSKADAATVEVVTKHPNFTLMLNTKPVEVKGSGFVSGVVVENTQTGEKTEVPVAGVFVEIGMLPSTDFAKDLLPLDEFNRVVVNAKNQRTSVEGVWAAGDCTDELYHQNNIAAGDAVKALEDIYFSLRAGK
jgi:alkyl hydroperoxide reductase subunit F